MPVSGDGPFFSGQKLKASQLNELAAGKPIRTAGNARTAQDSGGQFIEVDDPEIIYIQLTEKDTTKTPTRYGWREVVRSPVANANPANWTWLQTSRTAKKTDDYAIELNNQDLSISDGFVYRAERSPHTGEWLFFLRRRRSSGPGTCVNSKCTKLPSAVEFDLGLQNPSYSGPTPPVYYQNGHMDYQTMVSGSVCPLRLSTYTNNWSIFQAKAVSLFPYGQRVSLTGLNGSGSTASVDLGDVTTDLAPFLPYVAVTSWLGPVFPGKTCPALTSDGFTSVAAFRATQFAAVSVAYSPYYACQIQMTFTKGIRLDFTWMNTARYYTYSTNPATGQLVTNVQTNVTYNQWTTSMSGPYTFDNVGSATQPGPGYTFYSTDFVAVNPGCGDTSGSFLWGTWAIDQWV